MNRRTFFTLAAVAAVLIVLAILGQRSDETGPIAGESVGSLLLPELAQNLDSVGEVVVEGAGRERIVSLEKADDDWIVSELDGYPAAPGKIGALLIALGEAKIVEEKTANPDFYPRLGVEAIDEAEAAGLEVTLVAEGGRFEVVLGDSYGSGQRYARLAGEPLSYLIDRDPEIARKASDWVEPEILSIDSSRIQRVEISHLDGEHLVLTKPTRDAMNFEVDAIPEGRELQYAGVANVTGGVLQNLRLEQVARETANAAEPVVTTEFRTFDGLVITVTATVEGDEDPWLAFSADYDAEQALRFATDAVDDVAGEPAGSGAEPDDSSELDAQSEAGAIDARLNSWRYRIPSYQYSQMTRRMDDLLRALPESDE